MELGALVAGAVGLARRWEAPPRLTVDIDRSPSALPGDTAFSLARGFAAYALSLAFTLGDGAIAAYSRPAERVMLPVLDVLQSIPVLGFSRAWSRGMVALFPHTNVGLDLACVVMIFTGQAWTMTFSSCGSLRAIPADLREVAGLYGVRWWKPFRTVEVPSAMIGLVSGRLAPRPGVGGEAQAHL